MKKTKFYTLLCTTILIPTLPLIAADLSDEEEGRGNGVPSAQSGMLQTPIKGSRVDQLSASIDPNSLMSPAQDATPIKEAKAKKLRLKDELIKERKILSSPDIKSAAQQEFSQSDLPADDINGLISMRVRSEKMKNDGVIMAESMKIDQKAQAEMMERRKRLEEQRRIYAEKKNQERVQKANERFIQAEIKASEGTQQLQDKFDVLALEKNQIEEDLARVEKAKKRLEQELEILVQQQAQLKEKFERDALELEERFKAVEKDAKKFENSSKVKGKMLEELQDDYESKVDENNRLQLEKLQALHLLENEKEKAKTAERVKKDLERRVDSIGLSNAHTQPSSSSRALLFSAQQLPSNLPQQQSSSSLPPSQTLVSPEIPSQSSAAVLQSVQGAENPIITPVIVSQASGEEKKSDKKKDDDDDKDDDDVDINDINVTL